VKSRIPFLANNVEWRSTLVWQGSDNAEWPLNKRAIDYFITEDDFIRPATLLPYPP
jgi:hypothetical protein